MNESTLMGLMGSLFAPSPDWLERPPVGGLAYVQATRRGSGRRIRSGGRVYGMNGPQACERRRRQIARGMLRVTAPETVTA